MGLSVVYTCVRLVPWMWSEPFATVYVWLCMVTDRYRRIGCNRDRFGFYAAIQIIFGTVYTLAESTGWHTGPWTFFSNVDYV